MYAGCGLWDAGCGMRDVRLGNAQYDGVMEDWRMDGRVMVRGRESDTRYMWILGI